MKAWGVSFCVALGATLLIGRVGLGGNLEGTPVGGLRWEGGVLVPCPLGWRPPASQSAEPDVPSPGPSQPSEAERQAELERVKRLAEGLRLNKLGYARFMKSDWEEAVRLYCLALENRPNDVDILGNLQMARVALRAQKLRLQLAEDYRQSEAKAVRQMGEGIESLCTALTTLRSDACQTLLAAGKLADALRVPAQSGFLLDSRTVDLRHVREGVVDLSVLRPPPRRKGVAVDDLMPPHRTSQGSGIEPPRPARAPEPPQVAKAREMLKDPAVEAVLFAVTLDEALRSKPSPAEKPADQFAHAVAKEVCKRAGVTLRFVENRPPGGAPYGPPNKREHVAFHLAALVEARTAYEHYLARRGALRQEAFRQATRDFEAIEQRLREQGLLKQGETWFRKFETDPEFRARAHAENRPAVLRYEVNLIAAERAAFGELLGDVGALLVQPMPKLLP